MTMRKSNELKNCLNSALDRKYIFLFILLKDNSEMNFLSQSYLNKCIQVIYLQDYKCSDYFFHHLKNDNNVLIPKPFFSYFTRSNYTPKYYTIKEQWQQDNDNFCNLHYC